MKMFAAAFLAAGMFAFAAPCTWAAPQAPDKPVEIQGTKKSVMFPHSAHAKNECNECHHPVEGVDHYEKCATAGCHDDLSGKQPPALYAVMHNKKGLKFQTCQFCHVKVVADNPDRKKELTGCKGSKCHPAS